SASVCPGCGLPVRDMRDDRVLERRRPRARVLPPLRGILAILVAFLIPASMLFFIAAPFLDEVVLRRGPRSVRTLAVIIACSAAAVTLLAAIVCFCVWLYQAWRLVARGDEDHSPGLMVCLLFVPCFNFYWIFQAVPGLSTAIQQE